MDYKTMLEQLIKSKNERAGNLNDLDGIDCPLCKNKGVIYILFENELDVYDQVTECSCMVERNSKSILKSSGLYRDFETKTFERFITKTEWQKKYKELAIDYTENSKNEWFTILGQSGSGKTHICTAISKTLIEKGFDYKYFPFATDMPRLASRLKSGFINVKEEAEYEFDRLKKTKLLYIDDFLKIPNYDYIFEIIDYRYKNNLKTIISSEKSFNDITKIDEAVAGRIHEMSGKYIINGAIEKGRNFRVSHEFAHERQEVRKTE